MSTLDYREKRKLEKLFEMSSGYVAGHSDRSFRDLFIDVAGIDIHSEKYEERGTSKANKLRCFWELGPDPIVGRILQELISEYSENSESGVSQLVDECQAIANRLVAGGQNLGSLTDYASRFDAKYLQQQIRRMEDAVDSDPDLAIGTAKELIETCCKTILEERDASLAGKPSMPELTKATFSQLKLTREDIPVAAKGSDVIKRILSNLGSISNEINTLRNLYGTGHGKTVRASGLSPRHARLAVGASAALVQFLFESHTEQKA